MIDRRFDTSSCATVEIPPSTKYRWNRFSPVNLELEEMSPTCSSFSQSQNTGAESAVTALGSNTQQQPTTYMQPSSPLSTEDHNAGNKASEANLMEGNDSEVGPVGGVFCDRETFSDSDTCGSSTTQSSCSSDSESSSSRSQSPRDPVPASYSSDFSHSSTEHTLLSCFLRHNLPASACKDLIQTFKIMFPSTDRLQELNYNDIMKDVASCAGNLESFDYCIKCNAVFPEDPDVYQCGTDGCDSVRYAGTSQTRTGRRPIQRFVFADLKSQLKLLLESPGIWNDIQGNRSEIEKRTGGVISDITDGAAYRQLLQPGQFLHQTSNITCVMNTDGVNLYSSSRVELWPIFLAINEMSPGVRFARENMLLAGVWQGKGKPPFQQYFQIFSDKINSLKDYGVNITVNSEEFSVKVSVVCATLDLPAKASVLNMTYFNGSHACVTCEETGIVVAQGKGHSRCYPYRSAEDRFPTRSCDSVKVSMEQATRTVRDKGFCGPSGLMHLNGFDLVWGTVPDYMHGILLGVTKTLLCKWLSPTQSTQPYFVGKSLREISTRLRNICPPDCIERLPRDLEQNYNHLKATELQTWLLFYCVPCLSGILPNEYLGHIAKLSEAAHILLGDGISSAALARAEILLDQFYEEFEGLYGSGSCGLNVHNAGFHLVELTFVVGAQCGHGALLHLKMQMQWCFSLFMGQEMF